MALATSSLSVIGRSIADFLSAGLDASQNNIHIQIGSPADAAPPDTASDHRLNLFFYRIEPGGFDADVLPGEPWRIRLHCLITAFGVLEDQISPGENDLRLLGEVVRLFHETPILDPVAVNGETVSTRVVLEPLNVDEINQLWSTQGDVYYRPSVAYEMSLIPVIPKERAVESPLVGSAGLDVRGTMTAAREPFAGAAAPPPVERATVGADREGWAPRICFLHDGACVASLAFEVGSAALAAFTPQAVVAGDPGSQVTLVWEVWDTTAGWREHATTATATVATSTIDPDDVPASGTAAPALPFTDQAGQAVLYARRTYTRAADGAAVTVRSNPVLVTLFEVSP